MVAAVREVLAAQGRPVTAAFTIASDEKLDLWHQFETLMTRWRDIEHLSDQPGPFIYALYRTTATRIV